MARVVSCESRGTGSYRGGESREEGGENRAGGDMGGGHLERYVSGCLEGVAEAVGSGVAQWGGSDC